MQAKARVREGARGTGEEKERVFLAVARAKKTRLSLSSLLIFLSLSPLTVSKKTSTGEAKIVPIFAKNVCRAVFVRGGGVLLFFSR